MLKSEKEFNSIFDMIIDKLDKVEEIKREEELNKKPYVIVRTYSAGVHAGYLVNKDGKEVMLEKARRLFRWAGALTLSELAQIGSTAPELCKFSIEVDKILLLEAIEIIPVTKKAQENLQNIKRYIPE